MLCRNLRKFDLKSLSILLVLGSIVHNYFKFDERCQEHFLLNKIPSTINSNNLSRNDAVLFVGGGPQSGSLLMIAMLDAHPLIRCVNQVQQVGNIFGASKSWFAHPIESMRLDEAGVTREISNNAVATFIFEIIGKQKQQTETICYRDSLTFNNLNYASEIFPKGKFILMIRDVRAAVFSVVQQNIDSSAANMINALKNWNSYNEVAYNDCLKLGQKSCIHIFYEQLVLRPENEMKKILDFLNVPWNKNILNHEKFIGKKSFIPKTEEAIQLKQPINLNDLYSWVGNIPEQVLKEIDKHSPMMKKFGYDTKSQAPNYEKAAR